MKKILYFLKSYKSEFSTAIFAAILTWLSYIFYENQQISFSLSCIVILISLIVFVCLRLKEKGFYFIPLAYRKDKDDWIGRGDFRYSRTEKCFLITKSDSGYIYSRCLTWSDYKLVFEFKIIENCLGAILRAVNLSNYVMLQVKADGIRPHIRINGGWSVWESEAVKLNFKENLSLDKWYKCILSCELESINIKLFESKEKIFDRVWNVPQGAVVFKFKKNEEDENSIDIPFPIVLEYGSIGFRNAGTEKALIKNVLIEKS